MTFTFPLSENNVKNKAFTEVAARMLVKLKEAKRASAIEQKPENEKYYLRIWLVSLGLDDSEYKVSRKALLEGIT